MSRTTKTTPAEATKATKTIKKPIEVTQEPTEIATVSHFLNIINNLIDSQNDIVEQVTTLILDGKGDKKMLEDRKKLTQDKIKNLLTIKKLFKISITSIKDVVNQQIIMASEIQVCNIGALLDTVDPSYSEYIEELKAKKTIFDNYINLLYNSNLYNTIIAEAKEVRLNKQSAPSFSAAKKSIDTFLNDNVKELCDLDKLFFNIQTVKNITMDVLKATHKSQKITQISFQKFVDVMQSNICAKLTGLMFKFEAPKNENSNTKTDEATNKTDEVNPA